MKPADLLMVAMTAGLSTTAFAQTKTVKPMAKPGDTVSLAPVPGAAAGVLTVSDYELNTFVFPAAVTRVLLPSGAGVSGDPLYLAGNTQVALEFTKGQDRPIQMMVELVDGQVVHLRVSPKPVMGQVHRVKGTASAPRKESASGFAAKATGNSGGPRAADVELLKVLAAQGQPPSEFESVALPDVARFDKFSVVPLAGWTDGARRVFVFSLVATPGQTAVVSPPQFYRQGITAVMVDGDVVDETNSPQLYLVEEVSEDE